ncbi:uncharacterized protein LOC118190941 [Stegodyphus dumicola]|uniref:uncharacterized protein LOC118183263 n=1 Tax=Stegodyphus dumicola TaxID=202533 RepID=UPI0015AA11FD|nr:uncharacterized protein LOC118183263 [Stegodyphus dumicola]XP_035217628.1 uncharacterized protein LOC118190941 [Stegodyphus dumicola]
MSEHNSVYQAEMAALRETLNWILRELTKRHCIHIYSDALSVLTALSRPEPKNEILEDIKDLFKRALGYHVIHVHWIKAHIGHPGNERADALAKEAALGDGMDYFDVRPARRKMISIMKNFYYDKWKQVWSTSIKRNRFLNFIEVSNRMKCYMNIDANQIITNHGRFPFYLHRFHLQGNDKCLICDKIGDADHFVESCILTRGVRLKYGDKKIEEMIVNSNRFKDFAQEIMKIINGNKEKIGIES